MACEELDPFESHILLSDHFMQGGTYILLIYRHASIQEKDHDIKTNQIKHDDKWQHIEIERSGPEVPWGIPSISPGVRQKAVPFPQMFDRYRFEQH